MIPRGIRPLLAALCLLLIGGCADEPTLEQQIIGVIGEMEGNAETGERKAFMDRVADAFSGQQGTLNYTDFQRFMFYQWNQNRRLHAQLFPIAVTRGDAPNLARARFKVLVTGGSGWLPERGQLYQVETEWVSEGSDWQLLAADWVPVSFDTPE